MRRSESNVPMLILLILSALILVPAALAQSTSAVDTRVYIAQDESYSLVYPADWSVSEQQAFVIFTGQTEGGSEIAFTPFGPGVIAPFVSDGDSPAQILNNLRELFPFIVGEAEAVRVDGRAGALAATAQDPERGIVGFAVLVAFSDGGYGMLVSFNEQEAQQETLGFVTLIAEGFDSPTPEQISEAEAQASAVPTTLPPLGSAQTGNTAATSSTPSNAQATTPRPLGTPIALPSTDTLTALEDVPLEISRGDREDVLAQLREFGLIGPGGEILLQEERLVTSGEINVYNQLSAVDEEYQDIVMYAEMIFVPGDPEAYEECALVARAVTDSNGSATRILQVGIDDTNGLFYYDLYGDDVTTIATDTFADAVMDSSSLQSILFIANGESLTGYFNGTLAFVGIPIDQRAGSFGFSVIGSGTSTRCELRNVWVLDADAAGTPGFAGQCEVSSNRVVNRRFAPTTESSVMGQVNVGDVFRVVGQTRASDGFVWWLLDDDTWVRSDVVSESGNCEAVRFVPS